MRHTENGSADSKPPFTPLELATEGCHAHTLSNKKNRVSKKNHTKTQVRQNSPRSSVGPGRQRTNKQRAVAQIHPPVETYQGSNPRHRASDTRLGRLPVCVRWCTSRCARVAPRYSQCAHGNGFSPVCLRSWTVMWYFLRAVKSQCWQLYRGLAGSSPGAGSPSVGAASAALTRRRLRAAGAVLAASVLLEATPDAAAAGAACSKPGAYTSSSTTTKPLTHTWTPGSSSPACRVSSSESCTI